MADGDIIRITKTSRSEFINDVIRIGQYAECYNTDLSGVGLEAVRRFASGLELGQSHVQVGSDSTSYYFFPIWNKPYIFALPFKFQRAGFKPGNAYSAGQEADIPYYDSGLDDSDYSMAGREIKTAAPSTVTTHSFQFQSMAGDVTAYIRINGTKTDLGTITVAEGGKEFVVNFDVGEGDLVLYGFYSSTGGTYLTPGVTSYIRSQGNV